MHTILRPTRICDKCTPQQTRMHIVAYMISHNIVTINSGGSKDSLEGRPQPSRTLLRNTDRGTQPTAAAWWYNHTQKPRRATGVTRNECMCVCGALDAPKNVVAGNEGRMLPYVRMYAALGYGSHDINNTTQHNTTQHNTTNK